MLRIRTTRLAAAAVALRDRFWRPTPPWSKWIRRWLVLSDAALVAAAGILTIAAPTSGLWRWPLGGAVALSLVLGIGSYLPAMAQNLGDDDQRARRGEPVARPGAPAASVAAVASVCAGTAVTGSMAALGTLAQTALGAAIVSWMTGAGGAEVLSAALPAGLTATGLVFAVTYVVAAWRRDYMMANNRTAAAVAERRDLESYHRGLTDGIRDRDEQYRRLRDEADSGD